MLVEFIEDYGVEIEFINHYRAAKTKLFKINNSRNYKVKRNLNLELIRLAQRTIEYANSGLEAIISRQAILADKNFDKLVVELQSKIPLAEQIINVAHRRIVKGEKIPVEDKLISLFEDHSDIISKGKRDILFGHKVTLTTGKSGLLLDLIIHDGNPSDATVVPEVIENHKSFYKESPETMVFDGCYGSRSNNKLLIAEGVATFSFSKGKNLDSELSKFA